MNITLYTDGACDVHASNQPGGWAAIIVTRDDKDKILKETVLSGGRELTTNNQMELTGIIEGLKQFPEPIHLTIVSDSKYVIDGYTKNYKINVNQQLWHDLKQLARPHKITWKYVKGHAGHEYNERCDKLAVAEKNKFAGNATQSRPTQQAMTVNTPVKIYLKTQASGSKSTAWASLIINKDTTQELSDIVKASEPETVLIGALKTLKSLASEEPATLYTDQEYLSKGMNEWLAGWIKRGWKTSSNEPVKYADKWQELQKLADQKTVYFVFVKNREGDPQFERTKQITSLLIKRAKDK